MMLDTDDIGTFFVIWVVVSVAFSGLAIAGYYAFLLLLFIWDWNLFAALTYVAVIGAFVFAAVVDK